MAVNSEDRRNSSIGSSTSYWLRVSVVMTIVFIASCKGVPVGANKKPSQPDQSLLTGAVSELEDALARLKQYAAAVKSNARPTANQDDEEDPSAESIERDARDEDYRQEPEIAAGFKLDRLEKNLDETREKEQKKSDAVKAAGSDVKNGDLSVIDLIEFIKEKQRTEKKEKSDLSLNDALDYLANLKLKLKTKQ